MKSCTENVLAGNVGCPISYFVSVWVYLGRAITSPFQTTLPQTAAAQPLPPCPLITSSASSVIADIVGDCYIVVAGLIKEDQDGFVCVDEIDEDQVSAVLLLMFK